MPPIARPRGLDRFVSMNTSNTSSPVCRGRIVVPPPPLPFPDRGGDRISRSGMPPPSMVPATRTWKSIVAFEVAPAYFTMSKSGSRTDFESVSDASREVQSSNSPSIWILEGGATTYARIGSDDIDTGTEASETLAPVNKISTACPEKKPGAETETRIVAAGRPWVKFTDSGEMETITPAVALNVKPETCNVAGAGAPTRRARISKRAVVPLRVVVSERVSSRIPPPDADIETRLRLDEPRKSLA